MELKKTPLTKEHEKLGARLAPFGGWLMPIQYAGIIREHNWTRSSASLFDICHMGEFNIRGETSSANLERLVTFNLEKMPDKSCHYGFMLDENGGIIDDIIVYKIEEERYMMVVNAATSHSDETHIEKHLGKNVFFENVSDRLGKLDLQGPSSRDVLKKIIGEEITGLKYYTFGYFTLLGEKVLISRTGYTGELGYELYIKNEKVKNLWDLLLRDERVKPAGLGARDTLRLEMGYPLYGQDIERNVNPVEAGFERFVDFNKDFIGKGVLLDESKKGVKKKFSYFITNSRRAPRHNYKIYSGDEKIGVVTSGTFSPSLSRGIGAGYIDTGRNKCGSKIILKEDKVEINAKITDKPFYKKGSAKN